MEEKSPEVAPLENIPKTEAVFEESTQGNSEVYERFVSIVTSLEEVGSICDLAWNHFDKGSEQCSLEVSYLYLQSPFIFFKVISILRDARNHGWHVQFILH